MKLSLERVKPMHVVALLLGLLVDFRWLEIGHKGLFSGVLWENALWWLAGIFLFFGFGSVLGLIFDAITVRLFPKSSMQSRMRDVAEEQVCWFLPGAILHYLVCLIIWRDTESFLFGWAHLVVLGLLLLLHKARRMFAPKEN